LSCEIINSGLDSTTVIKGVIFLVFEKALDEPKYSSMYAQLCKRLSENAPNFDPPDTKNTTFKRILLSNCRHEFENRAAVSSAYEKRNGKLSPEEQEAKDLAKRKMLGNIKFIGELGKLEILHDSILHRCCEQLLVGRRKQAAHEQIEDIECLAQIMKTCGRLLDTQKAKVRMDQYFERINNIIDNPEIPTRIKFLLQDINEMRENKWLPRKLKTPDGPRTIQQVREDAARDGCIYLPQQDHPNNKPPTPDTTHMQQFVFNRSKGMDDIFGGFPLGPAGLGSGPGVINAHNDQRHNNYNNFNNFNKTSPPFEKSYNNSNSNYNRSDNNRDDNRDYKPKTFKRDNIESKFEQRIDFGDRFTANRNKTHPNNKFGRGGGGRGDGGAGMGGGFPDSRQSPSYDKPGSNGQQTPDSPKDLPPRFKRMGMSQGGTDPPPLRPSLNSMMFKPKTPSSLPKSAMANIQGVTPLPAATGPKLLMTTNEPALIITKSGSANKKNQEKKNQGPTKVEVFGKISEILKQLLEHKSTNEAATAWKEDNWLPAKMVNNALIHLYKEVVKQDDLEQRTLALALVSQLVQEGHVTQIQCKESLARIVNAMPGLECVKGAVGELAAWSITTDMATLAELAEMTEGGASHPLFLETMCELASKDKDTTINRFKESGVKLLDQLPQEIRTEERLGEQLEELKLSFLVPLLAIKGEMWRQLETSPDPTSFLAWVRATVPAEYHAEPGFVSALVTTIMRYIVEKLGDTTDGEKEMIEQYKPVLQQFLSNQPTLQLVAVYALQVYCFSINFPKGLLLRWFVSLYEADVVDEHAFIAWKEDVNDTYPGKGKALFQVNQWLTWLEEAESEEEEEDE